MNTIRFLIFVHLAITTLIVDSYLSKPIYGINYSRYQAVTFRHNI